jgi:hypothetical protein
LKKWGFYGEIVDRTKSVGAPCGWVSSERMVASLV